ncbi:MAG: cupin domain-containing protein [Proteobacteria bacterium]|nr:cupin domain-containing protein [Pseudomonadota bacterium]
MTQPASADHHGGSKVIMRGNLVTADPETIKWERNGFTPWGMHLIVIHGDPQKPEPYTFRVKMPSGYKLPPHKHKDQRTVTVLTGTYWIGSGEQFDMKAMETMEAGAFYITEANTPHYAWARTEVILQESGYGPTDLSWINPEDDPKYQK